nr:ATP-binding protein [Collinsella intestinalis]
MARIDDTPQHKAVREGLTNALVHADYCGRTGVVVIRRRSAVEFSNPGCLRIPVEVVEGGGVSDPRNKTLMTMFNLIGRGDKAGSGFDVFRDAAAYAGVAEPELVEYLEPDRTKLMLCVEVDGSKLVDDDNVLFGGDDVVSSDVEVVSDSGNGGIDVGITDNNGGLNDSNGGINDADGGLIGGITNNAGGITRNGSDVEAEERPAVAEEVVLQIVQKNPNFTVSQMAAALGTSKRSMERLVSSLKSQGRLVRVGAKRNGHWEVRG